MKSLVQHLAFTIAFALLFCAGFAAEDSFQQEEFAIGFWVDPPVDAPQSPQYYRDLAEANFNVVIGGFGARSPEQVRKQLELCQENHLKAIVSQAGLPPDELPEGPACLGYTVRDEPSASDFPQLARQVAEIKEARPGRLAYINLFPDYAEATQLGTDDYSEYVESFVEQVNPQILSMDHYPLMKPGHDGRDSYCHNLEVMRKAALKHDLNHWNFFNVMPYGSHSDPTEAQIRWQVFTSLAYGSKGVLYFCYWTPRGGIFKKGGAIITREGRKTRHYDQARRVNRTLKNIGPTVMKLTSKAVYRVTRDDNPDDILADTPIKSITPGDYLIGVFRHADGRSAVLIDNYDITYTAWPTVGFKADDLAVKEVSQENGGDIEPIDDSPELPGLQASLDSGQGRLFLIGDKQ